MAPASETSRDFYSVTKTDRAHLQPHVPHLHSPLPHLQHRPVTLPSLQLHAQTGELPDQAPPSQDRLHHVGPIQAVNAVGADDAPLERPDATPTVEVEEAWRSGVGRVGVGEGAVTSCAFLISGAGLVCSTDLHYLGCVASSLHRRAQPYIAPPVFTPLPWLSRAGSISSMSLARWCQRMFLHSAWKSNQTRRKGATFRKEGETASKVASSARPRRPCGVEG